MKKLIILLGMMVVLLSMVVSAEPSYVFKQNTIVDLKVFCFNETNSVCDSATLCQISVLYPNQSSLINNASMSFNESWFNKTLTTSQTSVLGEYTAVTTCQGVTDGYSTFSYEVTHGGVKREVDIAVIIPLVLFGILFIVGGIMFIK